jgi:iron complex outermembrane receptor protein
VERFSGGVFLQAAMNQRSLGAGLRLDRRLGDHHLLGGVELGHSGTYGLEASGNLDFRTLKAQTGLQPLPGLFEDASRTTTSLYLEDAWTANSRISATAGVRLDHGSDYGDQLSPRAALVATLPRDLSLKLLYGRAFRPPSFAELAFYMPGLANNPDLKPSTTDTTEAALVYKGKDLRLAGTVFLTWLRHPIGPEGSYTPVDPSRLVNLPGVDVRGFELEARRSFGMSDSIFLSYTHQEAEDAETGARRADIPRDMATLGATVTLKEQYTITPTLLLRSSRSRAAGDPRPALDGYGIFNLTLRARGLVRNLDVAATAGNLFDTEYLDPSPAGSVPGDYPRPGRSLFLGASYKF